MISCSAKFKKVGRRTVVPSEILSLHPTGRMCQMCQSLALCRVLPVRLRPAVGCRVFAPSVLEYFKESFYPFGMAPIGDDLVPLL